MGVKSDVFPTSLQQAGSEVTKKAVASKSTSEQVNDDGHEIDPQVLACEAKVRKRRNGSADAAGDQSLVNLQHAGLEFEKKAKPKRNNSEQIADDAQEFSLQV